MSTTKGMSTTNPCSIAKQAIDDLCRQYQLDPDRIYETVQTLSRSEILSDVRLAITPSFPESRYGVPFEIRASCHIGIPLSGSYHVGVEIFEQLASETGFEFLHGVPCVDADYGVYKAKVIDHNPGLLWLYIT